METPKVTTENIKDNNISDKAHWHLRQAANAITPTGSEYIGSFSVHVYKGTMIPSASFGVQIIGKVPEQIAIEAAKTLKDRMMENFGHRVPRKLV